LKSDRFATEFNILLWKIQFGTIWTVKLNQPVEITYGIHFLISQQ